MKTDITVSNDLTLAIRPLGGDACVVLVTGSIDSTTADGFTSHVRGLPSESSDVLVDLFGVRYLSSAGLGALLSLMKTAKERGGRFAVYDPSLSVRRVLEISKLGFLDVKNQALEPGSPFAEHVRQMDEQRAEARQKRDALSQKLFQRPSPPPKKSR